MKITLTINNKKEKSFDIPENRLLLDLLRAHGYWHVRHGCETGDCGNCAVLVDDIVVNSCRMLAAQVDGKSIVTFAGINTVADFDPINACLLDFGDPECGYCIPGMLISMKALTDKIADPTDEEIVEELAGHVCRCTRSPKPLTALLKTIKKLRGK